MNYQQKVTVALIMHSYSLLNQERKIETPPDNYVPDKVGVVNLSKMQEEREKI